MGFPKRVDVNQKQVVVEFRRLGAIVWVTSQVGKGFPDIVVLVGSIIVLVEIKDGGKPPSCQKLTPMEAEFHLQWHNGSVEIVKNLQDVQKVVDKYKDMRLVKGLPYLEM